jgi:uncharacterized protein (TIGR00369 family)
MTEEDASPKGFALFERKSPLVDPWRPIYARLKSDRLILGVFVREPHLNSRGTAHGGLVAALADWAMGLSCGVKLSSEGVAFDTFWTASLTVDYLEKVEAGQWLTFDTTYIKTGRTLCHAECDVCADWETVARARGSFRVAHHASSSS